METTSILVADDNPALQKIMRRLFAAEGVRVVCIGNGLEALANATRDVPDIVILDVNMPGMDGYAVCRALREDYRTRHIPVLMLTGMGPGDAELRGLDMGADDYLTKPFDAKRLKARTESLLRRGRSRMELNPLTHFPGNHAIKRECEERLRAGKPFTAAYADIRHFKAVNDSRGFSFGDRVILTLGETLRAAVESGPAGRPFVGHVGGDDFIVITDQPLCPSRVKASFAMRIDALYEEAGIADCVPVGLTLGQVYCAPGRYGSYEELARAVSAAKEAAKEDMP
ncbi:MAG: response regulator [Elusimicrobiota bacterium]